MCLCSWKCAIVSQEEQRASDMVLFTNENNDIATIRVSIHRFSLVKKKGMTNQLASLARREYFCLDAFWRVNLGMYVINIYISHVWPVST